MDRLFFSFSGFDSFSMSPGWVAYHIHTHKSHNPLFTRSIMSSHIRLWCFIWRKLRFFWNELDCNASHARNINHTSPNRFMWDFEFMSWKDDYQALLSLLTFSSVIEDEGRPKRNKPTTGLLFLNALYHLNAFVLYITHLPKAFNASE